MQFTGEIINSEIHYLSEGSILNGDLFLSDYTFGENKNVQFTGEIINSEIHYLSEGSILNGDLFLSDYLFCKFMKYPKLRRIPNQWIYKEAIRWI